MPSVHCQTISSVTLMKTDSGEKNFMLLPSRVIQASPVAPGIAIGRVMLIPSGLTVSVNFVRISPEECETEIKRFHAALDKTREQLQEITQQLKHTLNDEEARIFDAHLLLVDDRTLTFEVEKSITDDLCGAEYAVHFALEKFSAAFAAVSDEYLQERAMDVRDVGNRIIANLSENVSQQIDYNEPRIIAAPTLTPSQTVGLQRDRVLAFALETGSTTSHTAILARSLKIPAVVGVPRELLDSLTIADKLIVDGFSGKLIVNPDPATEESYQLKMREAQRIYSQLSKENDLRPVTRDGFTIEIAANADGQDDYEELRASGCFGVGLFRTEFIFMDNWNIPDEDKQFEIYKKLLISAGNQPVTIRTLDLGGDKLNSGIVRTNEQNPFLGLRGIRLCLKERRDLFEVQLRALMRAGVHGNLQIMLPMISCIDEVRETREIIAGLQRQMSAAGVPFAANIPLGVMIETPAAALIAGSLAKEADFFSIGTNDLIQYTIAVDRTNERVGHLYRPGHPAVIALIKNAVDAAERENIPVSVCGQTAEDLLMTPLLVGLGVNELSMSTGSMPVVRRLIRQISMNECRQLVEKALQCDSSAEVLALSRKMIMQYAPELSEIDSGIEENE